MSGKEILDIVKAAILLEHKGRALYESVAGSSKIPEVKELFALLAEEESRHIGMLERQFASVKKGGDFDQSGLEAGHSEVSDRVFSEETVARISGAGYEAAVISASLDFEKKAVEFYSEHALKASSENEKSVFTWLADWEKTHMQMLARLDGELRERIWYDNQFWPLD